MNEHLAFSDVLMLPQFSNIRSRKDCDTSQEFLGLKLNFPLISSNMDTVTGPEMAIALSKFGSIACLHRFQSVQSNIDEFYKSVDGIFNGEFPHNPPLVSVGVGEKEILRALELNKSGAKRFVIDIAHGASIQAVEMYDSLRSKLSQDSYIVVGNFTTYDTIRKFNEYVKSVRKPDAFKCGVGGGSVCTTREVTGCGFPTYASILSCVQSGYPIIADGGIRNSGDIAKALASGATAVMVGGLLAGSDETPGYSIKEFHESYYQGDKERVKITHKQYRGSASKESYTIQGKDESWRTAEGESTMVPYKGPVTQILESLQAGVKSAMSYIGAHNLKELRENVRFVQITGNGVIEGSAHGKT